MCPQTSTALGLLWGWCPTGWDLPTAMGGATSAGVALGLGSVYFDYVSAVVVEEYIRKVLDGSWELFVQGWVMYLQELCVLSESDTFSPFLQGVQVLPKL